MDLRSASGSAWATRVTPNTSISSATPQAARPRDCMSMSEIAAPTPPSALRAGSPLAAFRLGSVAL